MYAVKGVELLVVSFLMLALDRQLVIHMLQLHYCWREAFHMTLIHTNLIIVCIMHGHSVLSS